MIKLSGCCWVTFNDSTAQPSDRQRNGQYSRKFSFVHGEGRVVLTTIVLGCLSVPSIPLHTILHRSKLPSSTFFFLRPTNLRRNVRASAAYCTAGSSHRHRDSIFQFHQLPRSAAIVRAKFVFLKVYLQQSIFKLIVMEI